jgi:hypothetical protein
VWEKYHSQLEVDADLNEQDVTAKICLKILEQSCATNESVDRWVLPPDDPEQREDLTKITQTLEHNVRKLLDPIQQEHQQPASILSRRKYRTLRMVARARRRAAGHHNKKEQQNQQQENETTTSSLQR